jgi:hypothetical protein
MHSERKAKLSAKLLFPDPFLPTTIVGLSSSIAAPGMLRKRLSVIDFTT